MKNIIRTVICFGLLFVLSAGEVKALDPMYDVRYGDIEKMPIATPKKTLIMPIKDIVIDIMPISTKIPTPTVATVTVIPSPTMTIIESKPTETDKATITPKPIETVTVEPTIQEVKKTEERTEKTTGEVNPNNWFWGVIIVLLVLILAIQVWSTKKNEENQSKKEKE